MRRLHAILLVTGFLFLVGGLVAVTLYNKRPLDVADSKAIDTDPVSLYRSYLNDSVAARKNFDGKIVKLTGEVVGITHNLQNQQVLLLKTSQSGGNINCTMEKPGQGVAGGSIVTVKGICSGIGQGDAELGIVGDVYLTRAILIK